MDALYIYKHSRFNDEEIRYSLRGVHANAPFIENIWIFGDKPRFLNDQHPRVHHLPHEYTARATGHKTPIVNMFSLMFHASLIPDMADEFLWFCDDFIILNELSEEAARRHRYVERFGEVKNRGTGLWMDSLWRTYDLLKRFKFTDYNFESHTPTYFTKKQVFEAYCEFRDFITEDRFYGMIAPTSILNHSHRKSPLQLTHRTTENAYVGFHHTPPDEQTVIAKCEGKLFLNFDDDAYGPSLQTFLLERFPEPSPFELKNFPPVPSHRNGSGYLAQPPITGGVFIPPGDT